APAPGKPTIAQRSPSGATSKFATHAMAPLRGEYAHPVLDLTQPPGILSTTRQEPVSNPPPVQGGVRGGSADAPKTSSACSFGDRWESLPVPLPSREGVLKPALKTST